MLLTSLKQIKVDLQCLKLMEIVFAMVFYFWFKNRCRGKLVMKTRPGTNIPHLLVKYQDHYVHFKNVKNLLPSPFHIFFFKGKFQKRFFGEDE